MCVTMFEQETLYYFSIINHTESQVYLSDNCIKNASKATNTRDMKQRSSVVAENQAKCCPADS